MDARGVQRPFLFSGKLWFVALVTASALLARASPSEAIPAFSRKYSMRCGVCHTVPPKLNLAGLKFQLNGYRWSDQEKNGVFPFDIRSSGRSEDRKSAGFGRNYFQKFEIISGGPLGKGAWYFLEWELRNHTLKAKDAFTERDRAFDDLFVVKALSPTTRFTVGQFRIANQVHTSQRSSISEPLALSSQVDGFALSGRRPAVRLDYMKRQDNGVDGDYYALTIPLRGELALSQRFSLSTHTEGVFLQAYRRRGLNTVGAFTLLDDDRKFYGAIGTYNRGRWFSTLIAAATDGKVKDDTRLSWENELQVSRYGMVGLRWDRQSKTAHPNALVPYVNIRFPQTMWVVTLQYELQQQAGNRKHILDIGFFFNIG